MKYLKKYQNKAEENAHLEKYLKNKNDIAKHNQLYDKGEVSYKLSFNKHSDVSHNDFVFSMHVYKQYRSHWYKENLLKL